VILLNDDLRKMGVKNWKQRVQERKQWKKKLSKPKLIKSCRAEEEEEDINERCCFS
jgi:hypothetical protein